MLLLSTWASPNQHCSESQQLRFRSSSLRVHLGKHWNVLGTWVPATHLAYPEFLTSGPTLAHPRSLQPSGQ